MTKLLTFRPSLASCRPARSVTATGLRAALGLAVALATAAWADEEVYSFVDGAGVVHFSNVPHDPRYRPARPAGARPVAAAASAAPAAAPQRPPRGTAAFDEHIRAAARKFGLPPQLLKAVMAAESNFDPAAISEKGALGLMQLMPGTARDLYVLDVLDPAQNIEGGARYLRQLQDRFGGDLEQVLAAYNAGPERVRRSGGAVPAIPETQAYVRKVLGLYQAYLKAR